MLKQDFNKKLRFAMLMERLWIGIAVCLLVAITAAYISGLRWQQTVFERDVAGRPVQTDVGVVTKVTVRSQTKRIDGDYAVLVRIGQREVEGMIEWPVREGQRVLMTYRVGKSGRVYIKRAIPVDEPPPRFSDR